MDRSQNPGYSSINKEQQHAITNHNSNSIIPASNTLNSFNNFGEGGNGNPWLDSTVSIRQQLMANASSSFSDFNLSNGASMWQMNAPQEAARSMHSTTTGETHIQGKRQPGRPLKYEGQRPKAIAEKLRASNRVAAKKCREKKRQQQEHLEQRAEQLELENAQLRQAIRERYEEMARLTYLLKEHETCNYPRDRESFATQSQRQSPAIVEHPGPHAQPWNGHNRSQQRNNGIPLMNNMHMTAVAQLQLPGYRLAGVWNVGGGPTVFNPMQNPVSFGQNGLIAFQPTCVSVQPRPMKDDQSETASDLEQRAATITTAFPSPDSGILMDRVSNASNQSIAREKAEEPLFPTPAQNTLLTPPVNENKQQAAANDRDPLISELLDMEGEELNSFRHLTRM